AYAAFCSPPSRFDHFWRARARYVWWEPLTGYWLYGLWLTDSIEAFTAFDCGSILFFLFPVLLLGSLIWAFRRWRKSDASDHTTENADENDCAARRADSYNRAVATGLSHARAVMIFFMVFVCAYVAAVGCLFEFGENSRFRFATEPF